MWNPKKVIVDPYVGIYDVTIFDVPQVGDWPLKLIIKKDDNGYVSELQTNSLRILLPLNIYGK